MLTRNVLVIPCYNEENRLSRELVYTLVDAQRVSVLFVNDGSQDGTLQYLKECQADGNGYIHIHDMPKNSGKAEAVRAGFLWALEHGASRVGYTDADFATPPGEVLRLLDALEVQDLGAVLGCRVARLGAHIERHPFRHVTSRIFAILASTCMRVVVYDTQCGAKWFRVNRALRNAIATPFQSSWAFDVELLGRLLGRWGEGPRLDDDDVLEIPIRAWRDVGGSKVSMKGMLQALLDMAKMAWKSQRLGAEHTATLELVPIESLRPPHPRESWRPSAHPSVIPSEIPASLSILPNMEPENENEARPHAPPTVVDYPLSSLASGNRTRRN